MRSLLAASLMLTFMQPALAAPARVWISEFATTRVEAAAPIAQLPSLVRQPTLDISTGAKTSAAFNTATRYIRIVCELQCAVSGTGTATTADILLPALKPEYFRVQGIKTVSVIAAP
jgi:hypothetical protein